MNKKWIKKILTPLKFAASSLISFGIDYGLYALLLAFIFVDVQQAAWAYLIARLLSSIVNFCLNKFLVFQSAEKKNKLVSELVKYYALVVVIALLGSWLTDIAVTVWGLNRYIIKPFIDVVLFLLSYTVQRFLIFRKTTKKSGEEDDDRS